MLVKTTLKMRTFLVAVVLGSLFGMSQAMTEPFVRCFPEWTNADLVYITCNSIKIAQYCDPHQSFRNISKPGVSLEKKNDNLCLTIRNCSYDSLSCQAKGIIDHHEFINNFTVNFCIHSASISSDPGKNETHRGAIATGVSVPAVLIGLMIFILWILYKRVKCFQRAIRDFCRNLKRNRNPNEDNQEQEIKMVETFLKSGSVM